eukprot:CAMPEP_0117747374 /NCGR_PEP_ID=MMETSP0947-20121206/8465_1 /TAXON_ID=44440 /ORGANISM="Chattonella subsalsa, Strain CCMP2191" /LENGTH=294 /DNA_ID=CAMNT_0005564799 /DNA_START=32 /DNA_END=916 /DNA_ORIENTATION=+
MGIAITCSLLRWSNLVFYVINAIITFTNGYLYGESVDQLSDKYNTLITPSGWAFSIWGIIFTLEGTFAVWQLFQPAKDVLLNDAVSWWWVSACIFQSAWNFAFSEEAFILSAFMLGGIAVSLGVLCIRLATIKFRPGAPSISVLERLLLHFSFGLHGGWTAVAFLLNVNLCLVAKGYSAHQQLVAAGISIGIATLAGLWFSVAAKNMGYGLAVSWAFFGTAMNQTQTSELLGERIAEKITYISLTLSALMLISSFFSLLPYDEAKFFGIKKESPLLEEASTDTREPDFNTLFES